MVAWAGQVCRITWHLQGICTTGALYGVSSSLRCLSSHDEANNPVHEL